MSLSRREFITIYFPPLFSLAAVHSFNLIGTLVFYKSVCFQYLDPKYHEFCGNLENFTNQEDLVQKFSAQWSTSATISMQIPAMFASLIFSSLSDNYGRKFAIILGQSGVTLLIAGLSIFAAYPSLNLWFYIAICVVAGSTGFIGLTSVAYAGYISDTTSDSSTKTLKMTIYFIGGSTASMVASAQVAVMSHFYAVKIQYFCALAGVYGILAIVLTTVLIHPTEEQKLFYLKDKRKRLSKEGSGEILLCKPFKAIQDSCEALVQPREHSARAFLITGLILSLILMFSDFPVFSLINLYTYRRPFEWRQEMSSLYKLLWGISTLIGKMIGAFIFTKLLNLRDSTQTLVSFSSVIIFMITVSLAKTSSTMLLSAFLGMFITLGFATLQSFIIKLIPSKDAGKILGFLAVSHNLAPILSGVIVNGLYSLTASTWPGLSFLLIALLMGMSWITMLIVRLNETV